MQILHWPILHPQVSTGDFGSSTSLPLSRNRFDYYNPSGTVSAFVGEIVEHFELSTSRTQTQLHFRTFTIDNIISSRHDTFLLGEEMNDQLPPYFVHNNLTSDNPSDHYDMDYQESADTQQNESSSMDPIVVAQESERKKPSDDDKPPGDHYKDYRNGNNDKRESSRNNDDGDNIDDGGDDEDNGIEEDDDDEEDEERRTLIPYLCNNQDSDILRRKKKAVLIVNLYPPERGYTICCYVRELEGIDSNEIQVFKESHLIPYSETYLLDCIDMEIVPLRLVQKLEKVDGINLMRYFSSVVCEIRDYRRFSSNSSKRNSPVVKKLLLRPTNHTLFSQLDDLIETSFEDWKLCKRLMIEDEELSSRTEPQFELPSSLNNASGIQEDETDGPDPSKRRKFNSSQERFQPNSDQLSVQQRLELEKQILLRTNTGLCLDPSKSVGLIANVRQFERYKWNAPEIKNAVCLASRRKQGSSSQNALFTNRMIKNKICDNAEKKAQFTFFNEKRKNNLDSFFQFVKNTWKKSPEKKYFDKVNVHEALKLPPVNYIEYPAVATPTNLDELSRIGQPAERAILRPVMSENFVRKVDEYTLETERRKRPHTTKLVIYQRNGTESYFGELEQESFAEPNNNNIVASTIQRGSFYSSSNGCGAIAPSTKCHFELGSMKNVQLYVRQFTDIFTEDGRRPCKITYQKVGQSIPQVVNINDYVSMNRTTPTPNNATVSNHIVSVPTSYVGKNIVSTTPVSSTTKTTTTLSSSATASCSPLISSSINPAASAAMGFPVTVGVSNAIPAAMGINSSNQPPVQIVHPQPRSIQQAQISHSQILYTNTPTILQPQSSVHATGTTNVNVNLNLNSARVVHQQPLLTRPQIINVNLHQQSNPNPTASNINYATPKTAAQLLQQQQQQLKAAQNIAPNSSNNLRLKQPTLATLLLSGVHPNSGAKPITVAIQPQPQNQNLNQTIQISSSSMEQHKQQQQLQQHNLQQQLNQLVHQSQQSQQNSQQPIMIMVSPPSNASLNTNISTGAHQHHNGSVSVNLNTISLDSLLNVSHSQLQQQQNYVTTTSLISSNNSTALNRLNILRLSNNTNTVTLTPQQQQMIRQNTVSLNMNPNNPTGTLMNTGIILNSTTNTINQNQHGQLINTHNKNAGIISTSVGQSKQGAKCNNGNITTVTVPTDLQDLGVPDIHSLLSNNAPSGASNTNFRTQNSGTTTTIDGLNLDLNLNLNLNLGGAPTSNSSTPTMTNQNIRTDGHRLVYDAGNNHSNDVHHTEGVDSLFNALSEVIGPELGKKLDGSLRQGGGNNTGVNLSPTKSSVSHNNNSLITLNDLLASPPISIVSNNQQGNGMSPAQSPQSPSIASILSPISPNMGVPSNLAYSATPRLSALLAGTPSADSSNIMSASNMFDSQIGRGVNVSTSVNSTSYGNLLDRLVASSAQPQIAQRTGGSRLNPIATATPMLAATLAQGPQLNIRQSGGLTRPTAYRQIAPAPPANPQPQPQQLINLLGFVGNNNANGNPVTPTQSTIRVNANNSTQGTSGTSGSR